MHKQRVNIALNIGGYAAILLGFSWAVFFVVKQMWLLSALDSLLGLVGLLVLVLTNKRHIRSAQIILLVSMSALACAICLYLDIPSAAAPRSVHHYFLVLACISFLFFQTDKASIKYGVPAMFVITYLMFASSQFGIATSYLLPDSIRVVGTWINNSVAMILVYVILYIMLSEIYVPTQTEQDLRVAIEKNQLELYFQPQVDSNNTIWGAEALLRWNHPVRGIVPPNEFIPLAEQTGLILSIGEWAINAGCKQLAAWENNPLCSHLTLAVNVSAQQFNQADFLDKTILAVQNVGANKLKLELTESSLAKDIDSIINKMGILKAAGVGFALDDFGTGYSSLNYLKRMPLDVLKIDKSFVRDVLTDENDAAIATTITTLGNSLGLKVVAEGVETNEQRRFLIENNCFSFQGYLFSPPLPISAFEAYVANNKPII